MQIVLSRESISLRLVIVAHRFKPMLLNKQKANNYFGNTSDALRNKRKKLSVNKGIAKKKTHQTDNDK